MIRFRCCGMDIKCGFIFAVMSICTWDLAGACKTDYAHIHSIASLNFTSFSTVPSPLSSTVIATEIVGEGPECRKVFRVRH